jgi:hypothetical protein
VPTIKEPWRKCGTCQNKDTAITSDEHTRENEIEITQPGA